MHGMTGIVKDCQTCHSDKEILVNGTPKSIDCVDCHMAPASKSAVGMQVGNGWRGDVKTHIWAINTNAVEKNAMFNDEGNLVKLDDNGLASVTLDFACLGCHTSQDVAWASGYAANIHENGITDITETNDLPATFDLAQNYPNPFNPSTTIAFTLPSAVKVTLNVYSIDGRLVASLIDHRMPAGSHTVKFDGSNLSSGLYMYTIHAGSFNASKKMVVLK